MKKLFILTILFISAFASDAFAQWKNSGKLDVWTSDNISRLNDDGNNSAFLKEVRVDKNKGFDRVVFEFTGDMPHFSLEHVKPPITGTGEETIKVSGKYFVEVIFYSLLFPEDEKFNYEPIVKKTSQLPVISEVHEIEWFEGVRPFAVGLKANKLYRVSQLKNPTRLVIDFKQ